MGRGDRHGGRWNVVRSRRRHRQLGSGGAGRPPGAAALTAKADSAGEAAPHVTVAESEVLGALWRLGPLSAAGLVSAVRARQPWGEATIKTLLNRLMRKGLISSARDDGRLLYRHRIERDDYLLAQIRDLADRLCDGDLNQVATLLSLTGRA